MNEPSRPTDPIVLLSDADPAVRLRAVDALGCDPGAATRALDALTLALDDPDAEVRVAAIRAIAAADPVEAEAALAWALQSPDVRVATAAHQLVQGTAKLRGPDSTVWRDPSLGRYE